MTAPFPTEKLSSLGTTPIAEYSIYFDPGRGNFVADGYAADPKGPMYPAAVFVSVAGQDFRQFVQYNRIDIWEKLGGKDRKDDLHTLGFRAFFHQSKIPKQLRSAPVDVTLKIVAFDLSGFYEPPYVFRINPDNSITKISRAHES